MKYKNLFSKGTIGSLQLKNRVVMPAMGTSLASSSGEASQEIIRFYEERAKGGCGLIITEITKIDDEYGAGTANQLTLTKPIHIPQMERLARTVHKYDSKIFVQLHHPGRETHSRLIGGKQIVAPSAIMCNRTQEMPRALKIEEVEGLVKKFITGAKMAQIAGIDGVELHGAHGYLINQFISQYTNKRTDKYGGHFVNRMRFITEIIVGIKHICGKDFPISVRLSADEFVDGGMKLPDTVKVAKYLESIGVDALNISSGIYESGVTIVEPTSYPQGWKKHLPQGIKNAVNIPVIAVNVIRQPGFADQFLAEGNADFVGVARGHLADPEWCNKAMNEEDEKIRPCISCLYCMEELSNGGTVKCAVNPRMGRELEFAQLEDNGRGRCVVVIGGGPGGMEAARTLKLKGYEPVLFEKETSLGGALRLAGIPNGKEKMTMFVEFLANELKRLDVDVRLGTTPTLESVDALTPYAIYWAVGAEAVIPAIPGATGKNVTTANDVLDGKAPEMAGKKVVVAGSGMTGCETAEFLSSKGNAVTLIEMQESIGNGIYAPILFDINQKLKKQEVNIMTKQSLISINETSVTVANTLTGKTQTIEADYVVLSLGVKPRSEMLGELEMKYSRVKVIGDAGKVGRVSEAVREGYEKSFVLS